jgi:hypothetical protein
LPEVNNFLLHKLGNTAHNKGYNAAPEYRLGLRHIAQKAAQRRIAKTLAEIVPPNLFGKAAIRGGKRKKNI